MLAFSHLPKIFITKSARNKLKVKYLTTHALNRLLFAPDGFLKAPEDEVGIEETARTEPLLVEETLGVVGSTDTVSLTRGKLQPLTDSRFFTELRL